MVSFHIQLDVGAPLRWLESMIGNGQKPLSDRYHATMRELDMILLRSISILLFVATLVLVVCTVPNAINVVDSFLQSVSGFTTQLTRNIPGSAWSTIIYQLLMVVWFIVCS